MEYRKRSLWNRIWENDSLDSLSEELYIRDVYEERTTLPWRTICYGSIMSIWKGIRQIVTSTRLYIKNTLQDDDEEKIEIK